MSNVFGYGFPRSLRSLGMTLDFLDTLKRPHFRVVFGAGDEARTRYLHLGKVALYRMSYTRRNKRYYNSFSKNVNTFFPVFQNIFSYKESLVWRRKPSPKT